MFSSNSSHQQSTNMNHNNNSSIVVGRLGEYYHTILKQPSSQLVIILAIALLFFLLATNKLISDKNDLVSILRSYNNPQYNAILDGKALGNSRVGACTFRFLVLPSSSSSSSDFESSPTTGLSDTLKSIWKLKSKLFVPCVAVIMSSKDSEKSIEKKLDTINSSDFKSNPNMITAIGIGHHNRKRGLIVDELGTYLKSIKDDKKYLIINEGYTFCDQAEYHIMNVLDESKRRKMDLESMNHVAYRVSLGGNLNGFILTKYLLSKWVETSSLKSSVLLDILEKKIVLTYRFQLMMNTREAEESTTTTDQPKCYESLVDEESYFAFDLDSCSDSLFSPCNNNNNEEEHQQKKREFSHDTVKEYIFPSSSKYSISDFEQVESIKCTKGQDCNSCCASKSMKCTKEFFPFINRCDELKHHDRSCECERESGVGTPFSPYYRGAKCVVALRRSKFTCDASSSSISRLCPCLRV